MPLEAKSGCRIPLELELQTVVSHPVWVLGSNLWSSVGVVCGPYFPATLQSLNVGFLQNSKLENSKLELGFFLFFNEGRLFVSCSLFDEHHGQIMIGLPQQTQ